MTEVTPAAGSVVKIQQAAPLTGLTEKAVSERINQRLEIARRKLVDLSNRSALLNFRLSKGLRGFSLDVQDVRSLFKTALKGQSIHWGSDIEKFPQEITTAPYKHSPEELLERLRVTYREANSALEEQGASRLYLCLGMLNWKDSEGVIRKAPLINIPVHITRNDLSNFSLEYTGDEITENIALAKRLAAMKVTIPSIGDLNSFEPNRYFTQVQKSISNKAEWSVDTKAAEVAFLAIGNHLMFMDLDDDKWPKDRKPAKHPMLRRLVGQLPTEGFNSRAEFSATDFANILPLDRSQQEVLNLAQSGASFVVQGPPGTGKSTTIINLIADFIKRGKKVLFVAEKAVALQVVEQGLGKVGLGALCLDLHSKNSAKKGVILELGNTLQLPKPKVSIGADTVRKLQQSLSEIQAVSEGLGGTEASGALSAYDALLELATFKADERGPVNIGYGAMGGWKHRDFIAHIPIIEELEQRLSLIGPLTEHPWYGINCPPMDSVMRARLSDTVKATVRIIEDMKEAETSLRSVFSECKAKSVEEFTDFIQACNLIVTAPNGVTLTAQNPLWREGAAQSNEIIRKIERYQNLAKECSGIFDEDAAKIDTVTIRAGLTRYENSSGFVRAFSPVYRKVSKNLQSLLKQPAPKGVKERLQIAKNLTEIQELLAEIKNYGEIGETLFGLEWNGEKSSVTTLQSMSNWVSSFQAFVGGKPDQSYVLEQSHDRAVFLRHKEEILSFLVYAKALTEQEKELSDILDINSLELNRQSVNELHNKVSKWNDNLDRIGEIASLNLTKSFCRERGLGFVVDALPGMENPHNRLLLSYQYTYWLGLFERALDRYPGLREFNGLKQNRLVEEVRQQYSGFLQYNAEQIALKHFEELPRLDTGGQFGLINREFQKRTRHTPIRELLTKASDAVTKIKPVFMMSPESVAKYLAPDGPQFDVVIFDEASQVTPEDALGSILRSTQTIVVGDEKQLPPTNFFNAHNEDSSADDSSSSESILELCLRRDLPVKMLNNHYRSERYELIAVSNRQFYGNQLRVYPSPTLLNKESGLRLVSVPNGIYDSGASRTNMIEAETIVDAVLKHLEQTPDLSLGVVTMNIAQRDLIENLLEKRAKKDPKLQEALFEKNTSSLFIKNLESVQGDERDVILVSVTYGPNKDAKYPTNYGPLNQKGGERRLNVLMTRARKRCEVYTSLDPEKMQVNENSSKGVQVLQEFIREASFANLATPTILALEEHDKIDFIIENSLREKGYSVISDIPGFGHAISLGLEDPKNPGEILLGVVLDGKGYQGIECPVDSEVIRTNSLQRRGWLLHRVWTLDWINNPEREIRRIEESFEAALQSKENLKENPLSYHHPAANVDREDKIELLEFEAPIYRKAGMNGLWLGNAIEGESETFASLTTNETAICLAVILNVEAPIHEEELYRRFREEAKLKQITPAIRSNIILALESLYSERTFRYENGFICSNTNTTVAPRDRSDAEGVSRDLAMVAPLERQAALLHVVRNAVSINRAELLSSAVRVLGLRSTVQKSEELMGVEVLQLIAEGKLVEEEQTITLGSL